MFIRRFVALTLILSSFLACKQDLSYKSEVGNPKLIHNTVKQLTDIIVHDIFSPPVASRNYVYPSIAAYEAIIHDTIGFKSLAGQLTGLGPVPKPDKDKSYEFSISANKAFIDVGRALIFSEQKMNDYETDLMQKYAKMGVPSRVIKNSIEYGTKVANHILNWSKNDNYHQTRSFPKFSLTEKKHEWKPTPPAYMDAIEPHWREIRPFVLEHADQFSPEPPTPFDTDKNSKFYKETMEVYDAVKDADKEAVEIAQFWDCNPFVMNVTGHVMHATKKITPGGHWMGICSIASQKNEDDIIETLRTYAWVSIALADGFISCWDEKYRSNLTRPETVINEYIDEDWVPLLQTPPFPEHTSGHSVISTAAASVLTKIYGDNFQFDDDSEVEYGLPIRSFDSFIDASNEAAISRLYGGIHYRPAIDEGVSQGKAVGELIAEKIKFE